MLILLRDVGHSHATSLAASALLESESESLRVAHSQIETGIGGQVAGVLSEIPAPGDERLVERLVLQFRMQISRCRRLTNAHSKSKLNLRHHLNIFVAHHNYLKIHKTLRVSPCMEAGITTCLLNWKDLFHRCP